MAAKADRFQRIALGWMSVFVAAGFLVACAWDPPTIQRVPRETAAVDAKAKAGPAKTSTSKSNAIDDIGEEEAAPPEPEAPQVDLTNFKERLVGLEADEITDLMGTPDLERSEPPALIWQFRRPICSVDVFMFDDGNGQAVDHVEVRGAKDDTVDEKECFAAVLKNATASKGAAANQAKTASTAPVAAPKPAATSSASAPRGTSAAKAAATAGKATGTQKFAPKKPSAVLDDPTAEDEPPPTEAAPPPAAKTSAQAPASASKAAAAAAAAKGQAKAKASSAAPPSDDGDLPPDISQ